MDDDKDLNDALNAVKRLGGKFGDAFASNFTLDPILRIVEEVDIKTSDLINKFGQGRENIIGLKAALTESVTKVIQLGGSFDDIVKIQKDVGVTLGRNLILQGESYEKLYAATKVTGEFADRIVTSFKNAGISAYQSATELEKVVNISRLLGVNAQIVSRNVLDNMEYLNKFNFQNGVEGLAKMAANATGLRINMSETLRFAERVYNPEGAIETAAALQRLGVIQSDLLDPLRLLDLAQNDPTELQNQLVQMTQQFVKLNEKGQFEILPGAKRQLQEIASAIGMSYSEITKMAFGSAELDKKLRDIKFPEFATEDQKKLIANLTEMGEGGVYKIQVKGESLNLSEVLDKAKNEEGLKQLIEAAKQPKTMEELAREQLNSTERLIKAIESMAGRIGFAAAGAKPSDDFYKLISGAADSLNKATSSELISIKNLRKGIDENYSDFMGMIDGLINGDKSIGSVFGDFTSVLSKSGEYIEKTFTDTLKLSKEGLEDLNKVIKEIITQSGTKKPVTPEVKQGQDVLKHPGGEVQLLPQDSFFAMTNGDKFIEKVKIMSSVINNTNEDMINRLKNMSITPNNTIATNTTSNSNINLNINVDASKVPSHIDTNELKLALNNQSVKEEMIKSIKSVMSNNNLTQPSSGMMMG